MLTKCCVARPFADRNSVLGAGSNSRGIDIKPSVGRGGYFDGITFENITTKGISFGVGHDGVPLMDGNDYTPLVSGLTFIDIKSPPGQSGHCGSKTLDAFAKACKSCNTSKCYNTQWSGPVPPHCRRPANQPSPPLPPQKYGCKKTAKTLFGEITLPWGVCLPAMAPVNVNPAYPNWGPLVGGGYKYKSLAACKAACV
eukprot:SAG22_NODE_601_length_8666_cov_7.089413_3_plen_198_part_00